MRRSNRSASRSRSARREKGLVITGKQVNGSKVMYQVQRGAEVQWVDYGDMVEDIAEVVKYEKGLKERREGKGRSKGRSHKQEKSIVIEDEVQEGERDEGPDQKDEAKEGKKEKEKEGEGLPLKTIQ